MIIGRCRTSTATEAVWMGLRPWPKEWCPTVDSRREPSFGSVEPRLTAHREASMKNDCSAEGLGTAGTSRGRSLPGMRPVMAMVTVWNINCGRRHVRQGVSLKPTQLQRPIRLLAPSADIEADMPIDHRMS